MGNSSGYLDLYGLNGVSIGYSTIFNGSVDFSRANVTGLDGSSITMSYSTSGSKKYITFRQNGAYLGMTEII